MDAQATRLVMVSSPQKKKTSPADRVKDELAGLVLAFVHRPRKPAR